MACLREVVLAYGPTSSNASDFELMHADNRRKGIQCHLLDIYRKQQGVREQASLPFSPEGREKYLKMLRELFFAEAMFEKRFGEKDDVEEEVVVRPATSRVDFRAWLRCFPRRRSV
ncbi:hypothetical protein CRE_17267 [Caenorhabditis remanei]|uniref:Uncharacterized protein n=1 Tax=Caenorhabditis remanei TaxID=31234 RepID=E3MAG0_CAERE|nr:hypothetical protein CRE_17267 [Caenorhabditis remanei]